MNLKLRRRFRRALRRALQGLPRTRPAELQWVHSDRYSVDAASAVADPRRGQRILSFLDREGILRRGDLHRTRRVSMRKLLRAHDEAYLRSLETADGVSRGLGMSIARADVDDFLLSQRAMVGGTVLASRLALRDRSILMNLGGGLHHALRDRGQGFCLFNDVCVAIEHLRLRGFEKPVLIVDLDLHDGDGTRQFFADDPSVHTYSIHNHTLDPAPALASTSIELGTGVGDAAYLEAIRDSLPDLVESFAPNFIFYLAGVDPAHDDRLGDWQISAEALLERDRLVMETIRPVGGSTPVVILLAGGYGHGAWRYSARFAAWLATGRTIEPPATESLPMTVYRRLARHLSEPMFYAEPPAQDDADDWSLSADDLPGAAPVIVKRLLGRYTVHGMELALERLGLLKKVRALGYDHLKLEAEFDNPLGQTLRLVSLASDRIVLLELRGRIDRSTVPGMQLLFVEWLLSQNPNAAFPLHRPELSGQRHPGTGLLRDIASLLLLVCEHLELDGLAYVPTHVALALQSASVAGFVDEPRGARFHAALRPLSGRPFLEKVSALEAGRVVAVDGGEPYRWEPSPVVVPVSTAARSRFAVPSPGLDPAEAVYRLD